MDVDGASDDEDVVPLASHGELVVAADLRPSPDDRSTRGKSSDGCGEGARFSLPAKALPSRRTSRHGPAILLTVGAKVFPERRRATAATTAGLQGRAGCDERRAS
ncbi:hypothetical protein [Acuticoccus sp.]|uniref:hypothetical protein n=1 Tax=Acuticoccus sp. TaxID=1904378 RepID=UPI003B528EDE